MQQAIVLVTFWLLWPQFTLADTPFGKNMHANADLNVPLGFAYPDGTDPPLGMSSLNLFTPATDALARCAPDSPCSDAKAAWPLGAYSDGVVEDHQLTGQFAMIIPIGIVFLLTLLLGPGSARRKSF